MALTLIHYPPLLAPCRNDVWVEYGCGGYRSGGPPHSASVFITRLATPPVGHALTIRLTDGTQEVFTAVAGPADDSGNTYTIGAIDQLAAALNRNVAISRLYIAKAIPGQMEVVLGGRWPSVPLPLITMSAPSYQVGDATQHLDHTYAPNYSVRSTIWVEEQWMTDKWAPLPMAECHPGPDLAARENIAPLLLPYLGYDWPAYGQSGPMRCLSPLRRYRVQAWERAGSPPVDRISTWHPVLYAWYAGQRRRDTPAQGQWANLLGDAALTPWLTYRGRTGRHEVAPGQRHGLGWLRNRPRTPGSQVSLLATVHYTDGSQLADYVATDADIDWQRAEIAWWPCGFRALGLHALNPAAIPWKYTVQLFYRASEGGLPAAVSEPHTFHLVDEEAGEVHLEYVNSLGMVESVRCDGAWETALDVKYAPIQSQRTMAGGIMPPAATSDSRQLLAGAENKMTVSAGFRDQGEHLAILDLLTSPELRLVDHAGQRHLAVTLANGTHAVARRGAGVEEHLYALNLALTVGDAETAWGEGIVLAPQGMPNHPVLPTGDEHL